MKKIINKISRALQVVLLAPIRMPGKAVQIIKYIALALGVVETVMEEPDKNGELESPPTDKGTVYKEKEVWDESQ